MLYLTIKADTNDGDYVECTHEITLEQLAEITPMIDAIKAFKPYETDVYDIESTHNHNYPVGECVCEWSGEKSAYELYSTVPGFDLFDSTFIPHAEYGIHTIVEIQLTAGRKQQLL